jgi:hypothetical protein
VHAYKPYPMFERSLDACYMIMFLESEITGRLITTKLTPVIFVTLASFIVLYSTPHLERTVGLISGFQMGSCRRYLGIQV